MSDPGSAPVEPDPDVEKARKVGISDAQRQAILNAAGGDAQKAALMENLLRIENRGFGYVKNDARSKPGAVGAFQFMPQTWTQFGEGDFEKNAPDFNASANTASRMVDWIGRHYGSDPDVVAAYYIGGHRAANHVALGMDPPGQQTRDYVRMMRGLSQPQDPQQADPIWTYRERIQ